MLAAKLLGLTRCGVYTPYGAQPNGARTFSVSYFTPVARWRAPEVRPTIHRGPQGFDPEAEHVALGS